LEVASPHLLPAVMSSHIFFTSQLLHNLESKIGNTHL
jgi:hypothetical protein